MNATRHAKIYAVSPAQERVLFNNLVPLGDLRGGTPLAIGHADIWRGITDQGRDLYCSGFVRVAESEIHIISANGGIELGEKVYPLRSRNAPPIGSVEATLYKGRNHAAFISAEEQRGTAIVVTRK